MVIQRVNPERASLNRYAFPALVGLILCLSPILGWAQVVDVGAQSFEKYSYIEKTTWHVFGRVTDMRGDPLADAQVRVVLTSATPEPRVLKTNLKGEFSTEYTIDALLHSSLNVKLDANLAGYTPARETVEYRRDRKMSAIHLLLRDLNGDPDVLSMAALIERVAPRLRDDAMRHPQVDPKRKDFVRGCDELISLHKAVAAVPRLSKVVERAPNCVECRLLLTLALLDAGSWAGGNRQLEEAAKLNDAAEVKRPEPPFIEAVLNSWRGDAGAAAGSFQKALEIGPRNALVLQELGRVLVAQKNWEAADQYLEDGLRAGADEECRLLRVRALLELGDIAEASREMDQYVGGRKVRDLPAEGRSFYFQVQDRLELAPFAKVKSVISRPSEYLMEAMPELAGLEEASDQDMLPEILEKSGVSVAAFFRNFPNTASLEQVHQERLSKDGKVRDSLDQEFQYLLLPHAARLGLRIDEHRSSPRGDAAAFSGLDRGFMLTRGFASVSLLFHPEYQDGAAFRYLGRQSLKGTNYYVVAFAQKPERARMMGSFKSNDASAITLVQGVAWIDPATFQITRLRTDLLAPQSRVRLQRQTTEIQFKEVSFKEVATTFWLPEEVAVTVDWKGRTFRNVHHYSDFKLFNVEAKEEKKLPVVTPSEAEGDTSQPADGDRP